MQTVTSFLPSLSSVLNVLWGPRSLISTLWHKKEVVLVFFLACIPQVAAQPRLALVNKEKSTCKDLEGTSKGDLGDGWEVTVTLRESPYTFFSRSSWDGTIKFDHPQFPRQTIDAKISGSCKDGADGTVQAIFGDAIHPSNSRTVEITRSDQGPTKLETSFQPLYHLWASRFAGTIKKVDLCKPRILESEDQNALDILAKNLTPKEIDALRERLEENPSLGPSC